MPSSFSHGTRGARLHKRWLRRGAGWLVAIVSVAAILFAWQANLALHQRAVVAEVARLDGRIVYDYEVNGAPGPPGPRWLRKFLGDDFFADVAGIHIAGGVTDGTIAAIATLPHLRTLLLVGDEVSDQGLLLLTAVSELGELTLESSTVTDAGLSQLAEFRRLTTLRVVAPRVTDIGLIRLEGMSQLSLIRVTSDDVSTAGGDRLRSALPDCDVQVLPLGARAL